MLHNTDGDFENKLEAFDGEGLDYFGYDVAAQGDAVVVSSYNDPK